LPGLHALQAKCISVDNRAEVSVARTLDSALKERLRGVLDSQPVTEAELRKLNEEGRACVLILSAQLERSEQKLAHLASDPASSLAEIADTFRRVNELRPDLAELQELLDELQGRAREFRAAWVQTP
jgi:chromosome segregation ATPase